MAKSRVFSYLGWILGIGIIIYLGALVQHKLQLKSEMDFNATSLILYSTIFYIIIGFLLRLPTFINEMKQKKEWTFDWIKFVVIGLPSFLILLLYVIINIPLSIPNEESILPMVPQLVLFGNTTIHVISGVVFGYVLLDILKVRD